MKDNNLENTQKISHLYEIIDVPQATGVMFRTSVDEGSYIPTHWHRAVEIIYLLEGKLEVTIESQTFLMQADDCTLINANIMHSTKVHTAQHCYFVADSGRIYGNLHFKYSTVIFPIG